MLQVLVRELEGLQTSDQMQKVVVDIVKSVARQSEEYSSFEMAFQDHEQYHVGRTKQRVVRPAGCTCLV